MTQVVPVPVIDANGCLVPTYPDIYNPLLSNIEGIFGADIYIDPDSQDGQMIAVFAQALKDTADAIGSAYNAFSPATSQGAGLSSNVKINGIRRNVFTFSTAPVVIVGANGTQILAGQIGDSLGQGTVWALPDPVNIGPSGTVTVTATCTVPGDITADANTLTRILTPTRNWQTVTNPDAAVPGAPVEGDATLRERQAQSTSLPAITPVEAVQAAIENITDVSRALVYENDTDDEDANTLPPHSISAVVEGGDVTAIATAINLKKTPGTGTYGSTDVIVFDSRGIPKTIHFYVLADIPIYYEIDITALAGYVSSTAALIQKAVAAWTSALIIGQDVLDEKVYSPANLQGTIAVSATGFSQVQLDLLNNTYKITSIKLSTAPAPGGTGDIAIAFNAAAQGDTANINIVVT